MSHSCCEAPQGAEIKDHAYRRVLWAALIINGGMFFVEIVSGVAAGSTSLLADALDFMGDSANYGISLFVLGMAARVRSKATLLKGLSMGVFGLWVIAATLWHLYFGTLPDAVTMGTVGFLALLANLATFALLWSHRSGDSNRRSAWLCTRNDVIGNFAVLLAALGVFGTGTAWPDLIVATIMAGLALQAAWAVVRQAWGELKS